MRAPNLIFIVFCLLPFISFSQNETNNWFFGKNAGLSFAGGAPVAINGGQLNSPEACAAISDATTGNLLFYSDGITVWDASHNPMPNGVALTTKLYENSSTMGALIIPDPGNPDQYYLFTASAAENQGTGGFNHHLINMTQNGGLGDVASNNNLLFQPCSEQNHAVLHANCTDWWVMTRELKTNKFYAYLVTASGVQAPVITSSGPAINSFYGQGQGKFSSDGKKYAVADAPNKMVQICDFDNATGVLSNAILVNTGANYMSGLSFSPDNKMVYVVENTAAVANLYQYVILATAATTNATKTLIASNIGDAQLQQAKDGKVYLARNLSGSISVINNPNVQGTGCNFVSNAISLSPGSSSQGLTNFPASFFATSSPCAMSIEVFSDSLLCYQDSTAKAWVDVSGANGFYTVSWQPGNLTGDTIYNLPAGTYQVTVTDSSGLIVQDSLIITAPNELQLDAIATMYICAGDAISETAIATGGTPNYTYQWSDGTNGSTINVSPSQDTIYTVTVTDDAGCTDTEELQIIIAPGTIATVSSDTSICEGGSASLTASGGTAYSWTTGANTPGIIVSPGTTTTYSVVVSSGTCEPDTAEVTVTVFMSTPADAGTDQTITLGENIMLNGTTTGITYSWSPTTNMQDSTTLNPTVSPTVTTTYTLIVRTAEGCLRKGTVTITVIEDDCNAETLIYLPSAFSPNGDGVNDTFGPRHEKACVEIIAFIVYDRWGEKVFEATNDQAYWDGIFRNNILNSAVFDYYLEALLYNGEKVIKQGNVNLIR